MGRKWRSLFVYQAFVCFPAGQIYLGGRLALGLPLEITYKQQFFMQLSNVTFEKVTANERLMCLFRTIDGAGRDTQLLLFSVNDFLVI